MARWFRRGKKKRPANESESTGRVGQPKTAGQEALQPSYIDRSESAPEPELDRRVQLETQPESPSMPPAAPSQASGPRQERGKQSTPKGVVVLTIGLPGSGKTTWFKRRGVTPLSSDLLRSLLFDDIGEQRHQSLVFSTLRQLLRARLIARMPWNYVDATNLSPKERKQWIQMARSLGYEVHAVFFDVPLEVCLERNRRRERQVPEDVMHRMSSKLRAPTFDEGFAKIIIVRVKEKGAGQAADFGAHSDWSES